MNELKCQCDMPSRDHLEGQCILQARYKVTRFDPMRTIYVCCDCLLGSDQNVVNLQFNEGDAIAERMLKSI